MFSVIAAIFHSILEMRDVRPHALVVASRSRRAESHVDCPERGVALPLVERLELRWFRVIVLRPQEPEPGEETETEMTWP